jgi:hypothetical protein
MFENIEIKVGGKVIERMRVIGIQYPSNSWLEAKDFE